MQPFRLSSLSAWRYMSRASLTTKRGTPVSRWLTSAYQRSTLLAFPVDLRCETLVGRLGRVVVEEVAAAAGAEAVSRKCTRRRPSSRRSLDTA